ncbi:hypothetical protein BDW74DRAFT_183981 [Aspergillus multicolor]|uniref:uncharacterized protein n=1 Tax=Aspergillus multicolor TaxID=41759 RepID=UPI003CCCA575
MTNSSPSSIHRLPSSWNITIGTPITLATAPSPAWLTTKTEWTLNPGIYTPRQLVHGFAPLLDTVLYHLKPDTNARNPRSQLLDNIAALLSTETRESSLPFPSEATGTLDRSRAEIRHQAERIGRDLVSWAAEATGDTAAPDLVLRSRCEGHLLTPENADLMFGPRSKPHLMQLFNEYMHQMVLLRDALLPFVNYADIIIPITGSVDGDGLVKVRGLRFMEAAREKFMASVFTKQVSQSSIVEMGMALLVPGLTLARTDGVVGYGFQYGSGIVIPPLFSNENSEPLHLLQYIPAKLDESRENILFQYEFTEYYAAPKAEIPPGTLHPSRSSIAASPATDAPRVQNARLQSNGSSTEGNPAPVDQVKLSITFNNGQHATVDLGQIARGRRYSYTTNNSAVTDDRALDCDVTVHEAYDILFSEPGLVSSAAGGFHVIAAEEEIVALAVLGRLYPENVVRLSREEEIEKAVNAGKGFEPKFVVWF